MENNDQKLLCPACQINHQGPWILLVKRTQISAHTYSAKAHNKLVQENRLPANGKPLALSRVSRSAQEYDVAFNQDKFLYILVSLYIATHLI